MASRGMGDINPSKMPKAVRKKRRDNTDFTNMLKADRWACMPIFTQNKSV